MAYLKQNPTASRKELTILIEGLTEDGVKYNLQRLKTLGLIQREGADNGGHWRVIDNDDNELSDNNIYSRTKRINQQYNIISSFQKNSIPLQRS